MCNDNHRTRTWKCLVNITAPPDRLFAGEVPHLTLHAIINPRLIEIDMGTWAHRRDTDS